MSIENLNLNKCIGCTACQQICLHNCITMSINETGFYYPNIDKKLCVNCNLCIKVCPILSKNNTKKLMNDSFAIQNKNNSIRMEESSGGVFSLLAYEIIKKNGFVVGAIFNEQYEVIHKVVDNMNDLKKMYGTKYVQSNINNTFIETKKLLQQGHKVLFSGTPCQIAALLKFLQKKYDNLYTIDVICHGVPSPILWKNYVLFRKKIGKFEIIDISFRKKNPSWEQYSMYFKYSNGDYYECKHSEDLYMKLFLKNYSLRKSCFNCQYKGNNRKSDITLGDLWGIKSICENFDDGKGTSFVCVNTEQGKELLNLIIDKTKFVKIDFDKILKYNSAIIISSNEPNNLNQFQNDIKRMKLKKLVRKYCDVTLSKKIIRRLKLFIK